jgi:hypothetical protein
MCANKGAIEAQITAVVNDLASRGFRSLGVAYSPGDGPENWEYLGVLSLFDPPRPDSALTIKQAIENGYVFYFCLNMVISLFPLSFFIFFFQIFTLQCGSKDGYR